MKNNTIYLPNEEENVSLKRALEILTDQYIEDGQYCDQTVIDLRDALTEALEKLNLLK